MKTKTMKTKTCHASHLKKVATKKCPDRLSDFASSDASVEKGLQHMDSFCQDGPSS